MVGHPLVKVARHGRQRLAVERDVVRIDPEDLLPALAPGLPEDVVNVGKGLVDLLLGVLVDDACGVVPPAWRFESVLALLLPPPLLA